MKSNQKILIVDDKAANLFSLEQILKESGADVIRAESGNEALVATLNHEFSLALLDVQMPGMDGYELAELLRSEEKTSRLPIIFISAVYSSDYHVFKGYDAGAVDFLAKPFDPKILLSKVKVFLLLEEQRNQLEQSQERLSELNLSLERRVQDRTSELELAIGELRSEIEKRKLAEKDNLRAKKDWQEIFEAIGHMVMILDKNHTIIKANRATLEVTGLSLEEIIGQKCYTIFHDSSETAKECPFEKIMASSNGKYQESEIETLGKTFIVSCTPVFDDFGQLDKIIHVATDITKRKQLKKELIQAHKMEAIGSLAGGIAHDFNNILSAVLGFTELSLGNVDSDSKLAEDLQQVYIAGIRAKDLVQQILNFARKTDEEPNKPVRIDLVTKEVVKFLRSTIPATVEIKLNISSRSLVLANPVKIHQLLMNLCTNAAYAISDQGVLEISLHDVIMEEADLPPFKNMQPGLYQRLKISDTGCGIPEDIIELIFQPFFTTKGIHEGTGMGLAMVHSIVKECGGEIQVESQVGRGTLFTIDLPVTDMSDKKEDCQAEQSLPMGNESILLVDDERAICKLASRMLENQGYRVTIETDSEKAYAAFAAQPNTFDLVISDMTMPKLSGDELIKKMLAIRPNLPVILATGYHRRMSDPQAKDLGAKAYMSKPFEKASLVKTVRNVLSESANNTVSKG